MTRSVTQTDIDKIVTRFMDGKGMAVKDGGTCMYLAPDGNKCAVGAILSDEELKRYGDYEGGLYDLNGYANIFDEDNERMLSNIQNIHDTGYNWLADNTLDDHSKHKFNEIVESYGFTGFKLETKDD